MANRFYYEVNGDTFLQVRFGSTLVYGQGEVATFTADIVEQRRDLHYTRSGAEREQVTLNPFPAVMTSVADNEVEFAIESALDRAIAEAMHRLNAYGHRLGATIEGYTLEGVRYSIHVPFRAMLTAEDIMDVIRTKLNSSESLQAHIRIVFKKLAVLQPNVNELQARGKWLPEFRLFCQKKKSIVLINPATDPWRESQDCFSQFMLLGLSKLVHEGLLENKYPDMLDLYPQLYPKLIRDFKSRHELANDLMLWLAPTGQNEELVNNTQEKFSVQVILHDFSKKFVRSYPPPDKVPRRDEVLPMIIGLVSFDGKEPHVNFVTNISAFNCGTDISCYCPHCFTLYTKKKKCPNRNCGGIGFCGFCHECVGICTSCMTSNCGSMNLYQDVQLESRRCLECGRVTSTRQCFMNHMAVCDSLQAARCLQCSRSKHTGPCNMTRCMLCGDKAFISEIENDLHQCYLRQAKLKPPHTNYWTFDFECFLHPDGKHEIYLATAWSIYECKETASLMRDYRHVTLPGEANPVFVFWGEGGDEFFDFLNDPRVHETVFFAHNSGKYDSILLETGMFERFGYLPEKITRGCKIMSMTFVETNVTIQDSLCFIPTALRAMSSNFGIDELKKGHFPHKLMTSSFFAQAKELNFHVPTPPRSFFEQDWRLGCAESEEKELNEFLETFYEMNPETWDLKSDAEAYCISDTLLLGKTLKVFRESTMSLTNTIERIEGVEPVEFDCLRYMTLPSAVMAFYKAQMLPSDTFAVVNRYGALCRKEASSCVFYWYEQMGLQNNEILWRPSFDGIQVTAVIGSHIFWYLPCYDHGCTNCYSSSVRNIRMNLPMYACRARLDQQLLSLEKHEYQVNIIWEHSWNQKKTTPEAIAIIKKYEDYIPLDPRDAYKGGCTEMYKLVVPTAFSISDFVSQYPTMMYGTSRHPVSGEKLEWPMPVGQPSHVMFPDVSILNQPEQVGIIKCRVLPPEKLYAPFLGHKVSSLIASGSYEILYGLCRLCMEQRICSTCNHSDEERSFTGCWTLREIYYARSLGYKVTHITEYWVYERSSTSLFSNFIKPFIKAKILARRKGMVDSENQFTEAGREMAAYLHEMTGEVVDPSDFKETPALRTIAKLIMNSFYGKWGQRAVWSQNTRFFDDIEGQENFQKLLIRADVELDDVDLHLVDRNGESSMVLSVQYKQAYAASFGDSKKQDHIAAYITAYGRQLLHMMVHHVGTDVINTDTDSVAHIYRDPLPYTPGLRLGDFELEVSRGVSWCGGGRKMYIYSLPDGKTVVKQKGVSLKASMKQVFTLENMETLIRETMELYNQVSADVLDAAEVCKQWRKNENRPTLEVPQTRFNIVQEGAQLGKIYTKTMMKKTRFLREALKRRIVDRVLQDGTPILDTLPFGYVE